MNTRALLMLVLFVVSTGMVQTQTASAVNEGLVITPQEWQGDYTLSWWGRGGKTYYLQQSDDLIHWTYLPVIELGDDAPMSYGISSSASRSFFRVRFVDPSSSAPPSGLIALNTSSNSAQLTWTPSDVTKATTIELSTDGGVTWRTLGMVAAGSNSAEIVGLFANQETRFRARTGGTASDPSAAPTLDASQPAAPDGSAVSSATAQAMVTPLSEPIMLAHNTGFDGFRYGYPGFSNSNNRYLTYTHHEIYTPGPNHNGVQGYDRTFTNTFDRKTGETGGSLDWTANLPYNNSTWTVANDTSRTRTLYPYNQFNDTLKEIDTLTDGNTAAQFVQNVESWIPDYPEGFDQVFQYYDQPLQLIQIIHTTDELQYTVNKCEYKWFVNAGQTVQWLEVFDPADGSPPIAELKSWTSQNELVSPVFEVDPSQRNGKKGGLYYVLRIELRDIGFGFGSLGQWLQPLEHVPNAIHRYTEDEVAWIDPHGEFPNSPAMPQLEARIVGAPSSLLVGWSFSCQYDRGNGNRTARNQSADTVHVPLSVGAFSTQLADETWELHNAADWQNEVAVNGFFGGDATLTMQVLDKNGAPQQAHYYFRIGGTNPDRNIAKAYIQSLPTGSPSGELWFGYAIAKSESAGANEPLSRYNQFCTLRPKWDPKPTLNGRHNSWLSLPTWNDDGGTKPGGYGLFSVTGDKYTSTADIPRKQIWNWQDNAAAGMILLSSKREAADTWMTSQKLQAGSTGLPSLTVGTVTFAEGTNRTMVDAVAMKNNNGSSRPPSGFHDTEGNAPGFILEPIQSGIFCYWHSTPSGWALSRFNNPPSPLDPFNYVLRICGEIEE